MSTQPLRMDVRPILARGRDPFDEIMHAARDVPAGGVMIVVAPFDPVPLREVLGASGFTSSAIRRETQWEITFRRAALEDPDRAADEGFAPTRKWTDRGEVHFDARGLGEGVALHAVLAAIDELGGGQTLVAHLDRNIDALYPELARRDCEAAFVPGERAEVRLEIFTPP